MEENKKKDEDAWLFVFVAIIILTIAGATVYRFTVCPPEERVVSYVEEEPEDSFEEELQSLDSLDSAGVEKLLLKKIERLEKEVRELRKKASSSSGDDSISEYFMWRYLFSPK